IKLQGVSLTNADEAIPYVLNQIMPHGLRGLGFGILFAATATTLTGVWGAMSSMLVQDFCKGRSVDSRRAFMFTICCAGASYLLSNILVDQILNKLILSNIPVASLSFALLAGF